MMSIADGFYQGVCDDEAMHLRSWLYADHDSGLDLLESSELGDNDPQQRTAPSKPGKTAQNHTRRFVVHQYRDRAQDVVATSSCTRRYEGATLFPIKLHKALGEVQEQGLDHIISWVSHGRCFKIHNTDAFVELVMPRYFRQSKLRSFQRQLYLYGFQRLTRGRDSDAYYHECFLRGRIGLAYQMERVVVKGTRIKAASNPAQEPNFYMLPNVDSNERNKESMQSAAVSVASVSASIFQQARDTSIETPWYPNVPVHFIQPPAEVAVQKQENDRLGCFLPAVTNTDDTIASNIGEAVLGDESIDADMILDFCADWAPSSMVGPDPDMPPIVAFEQV